MTLWQGRIQGEPAPELMAFTVSLSVDRRLATDDLAGCRAHVHGLERSRIIPADEAKVLVGALDRVAHELSEGSFAFRPGDEDVHTAIERRVTEIAGSVGAKLHTGRSRNDQVVTALRLYTKRELRSIARAVLALQQVLLDRAEAAGDVYLPGYTHLQRAQPVLLSHHLLAHGWALARDVDRLRATIARLDVCPLGAGALAGSSLALDPDGVAADLGFARRFENSLDAVSDRDFVAEALFDLALLGVHLSRLGEEIVLWSTEEFGFLHLDDAWATGSSMLPQKKNPDVAELARGKSGRLIGHLTGFLATLKSLPLAYNRDLQEDKRPLFDAFDTVGACLELAAVVVAGATLRADRIAERLAEGFLDATTLMEHLIRQGVPQRTAHEVIGHLVGLCERRGCRRLSDLPDDEFARAHHALGPGTKDVLGVANAVKAFRSYGSTAPAEVEKQLGIWKKSLS
ncbi:MAG TPA: argininosuccinate lyase [Acidimicrobiales bacterium]|nr:argininosuccinate lyase [Acidimicrobiales bacterium]